MAKVITIPDMNKHVAQEKKESKPLEWVAWQFETAADLYVDLGSTPAVGAQ